MPILLDKFFSPDYLLPCNLKNQTHGMPAALRRFLPGNALLSAGLVWLVSVTLCSTRVVAEPPHEHAAADTHSDHAHDGGHHDRDAPRDNGCGCESFKAFPAKTADAPKVSAPMAAVLFTFVAIDAFSFSREPPALRVQNTGPPETESFAEHFLQRCLLSQAPPALA